MVDRLTYRSVNGWMDRQTDGQIGGWTVESVAVVYRKLHEEKTGEMI